MAGMMKTFFVLILLMIMMTISMAKPKPDPPAQWRPSPSTAPVQLMPSQNSYEAKSKLVAFILSFLLGGLGVDWFYLSCGDAGYILAGTFKLITFGGFGIWWLVDWIRVLTDSFGDGMGRELFMDM